MSVPRRGRGWLLIACLLASSCSHDDVRKEDDPKARAAKNNVELGIGYLQQGNRKAAIEKLQKALDQEPNYAPAHHSIALAYQEFGQFDLAEQHFRKAVELSPHDGNVLNNFGAFLCNQKRYTEGEEQFRLALRDPTYATPERALENAGMCILRLPDYDKAEQYLRQALRVNDKLPGALLGMARVSYERRQYLPARGYVQRLEALGPLPPQGLWVAVQVEHQLGDHKAAMRYVTELNAQFPDSLEAQEIRDLEAGLSK